MLAALWFTTLLNVIATQSAVTSITSNAPSGFVASPDLTSIVQPGFVTSPDASWRFAWDPIERRSTGPTEIELTHAGSSAFKARLNFTPRVVAVDNEGHVALAESNFWSTGRVGLRVVDAQGKWSLDPTSIDAASQFAGERRIVAIAADPNSSTFVVCLTDVLGIPDSPQPTKADEPPTAASLLRIDARTGAALESLIRVPPPRDSKDGLALQLAPIRGTEWWALEILAWRPNARFALVLDANFKTIGELDLGAPNDNGCLLQLDPSFAGIRVQSPARDVVTSYVVRREGARAVFEATTRQLIPAPSLSPELSLIRAKQVTLALPSDFASEREELAEQVRRGIAKTVGRGRVLIQDPGTKRVALLDENGAAIRSISMSAVDDPTNAVILRVQRADDGAFAFFTGDEMQYFDPEARFVTRERSGRAVTFAVDGGIWIFGEECPYLLRDGTNKRQYLERHADKRFFTEVNGVGRDRDRLVVLDQTSFDERDKHWIGRVALFDLAGKPDTFAEVELSPGAKFMRIAECNRPWMLLGCDSDRDANWIVRTDAGQASKLVWNEPGIVLGLESNGHEVWRLEQRGHVVSRYALPSNDHR